MCCYRRVAVVAFLGALLFAAGHALAQKAKPLAEADVVALLGLGLEDETITDRIKNGGVSFEVTDELVERLKTAGATEAVLNAVQEAGKSRPAPAASAGPPITYEQVLQLVSLGLKEEVVIGRIARTPPIFVLGAAQEAELVRAGATPKVIAALKGERPAAPQAGDITDVAIILDCSGSMQEATREGESKMTVAKRVVSDLVQKIPDGLNVTFVVYGHEVFGGSEDPRNCQAVKVARPLGPLDAAGKAELAAMISRLKPTGATPIALSLRTAGDELKKNNALCGLVLITDGLETCKGDPAGEAAALVAALKVTFGVNVVGFGVKEQENAALEAIADAGHGKYYSADSARELTESIGAIAREIEEVAKKPDVVDTSRRAVRVLKPKVEMPQMEFISLVPEEEADSSIYSRVGRVAAYGEYLNVPSSSKKYAIVWEPKAGVRVFLKRDFSIPDRRVVDIQPESILGMIQVNGTGNVRDIYAVTAGERSAVVTKIQNVKKYGEILVVPAGKYDIYIDGSRIEEDFEVEPGKLHRL